MSKQKENNMQKPANSSSTEYKDKASQAEDILEELHQLAGSVAAVFDSREPDDRATMDCFDRVLDALEDKTD